MTAVAARAEPASAAECAAILVEASAARRTVSIGGGMTKRYLGDAQPCDLELRTTDLAGIVDHVPADLTVTVRAGTRVADLALALARAGQFFPLDPPHADAATVGGVIAANSNGFWRARYGSVRDILIGTTVALADGSVVRAGGRVVKNVAGYDLNKLFTGSFGTLGVIVEATFKVLPIPPADDGRIARFRRGADAFAAADAVLRGAVRCESIVVERSSAGWRLLVQIRGDAPSVGRAIADVEREASARAGEVGPLTHELAPLRELPASAPDGVLLRAVLPLAAQTAFADTATRLDSFALLAADAASAVHLVHLTGDDDRLIADAHALVVAARAIGGTARIERRADRLRSAMPAWPAPPQGAELGRRLKSAFDPLAILEPRRIAVA